MALGSQLQPIRMSFPHKRALLQTEKRLLHQLSGWLVSDDPAGEDGDGPGLMWSAVFSPVGRTAILSGREIDIQFSGNS